MQTATTTKQAVNPWLTFLPAWVGANIVGWGAMYLITVMPFARLPGLLSVAFVIGLLQWLCLSSFLGADYIWLILSTVTYGGYLWAVVQGISSGQPFSTLPALLLVSGAVLFILGWLQYFALKSFVDHASVWVMASPIAATFAFMMMVAVARALGPQRAVLVWATFGAVYGALTGVLLVLLKSATKARPAVGESIPPWKRAEE